MAKNTTYDLYRYLNIITQTQFHYNRLFLFTKGNRRKKSLDVRPSSRCSNFKISNAVTAIQTLPLFFFLPERDYRTWLRCVRVFAVAIPSVVCRSVTLVHPTQRVEHFGKISSPLCTLAIFWPPCKILRRSSQGNPSVGGVKRKRASKVQRFRPIKGYIS